MGLATVNAASTRRNRSAPPRRGGVSARELHALHLEYGRTRDPEVRAELFGAYEGLAAALAVRFARNGEQLDDVRQAALLGLLHAIDRFDPSRGVKFTTFAWATIIGELKRHFRDRTWAVRVPRALQERYLAAVESIDVLTVELGRSPTIAQVAERTGLRDEEVIEALEVRGAYRMASLDAPAADESARSLQLTDDGQELGVVEDRGLLFPLLRRLPPRDREIVILRFVDELSQSEIAARVGHSQMHVSRRLARSLDLLRGWARQP